ncbi:MAG TPA: zf-TFIIB domain-containing protein [Candidatus Polarisedimenticolaceae bacterium]|nr:zf-TFIIB domain-containing protein [Candidatus Polarisedimenticolaceae bacterium]
MAVESPSALKFLVACDGCRRQYDAGALAPGSRFHCSCGATVVVPRRKVFEAEVVRCSSCSAPRTGNRAACTHCGADFTLHERDLQTICPQCMARISNLARFCHHCATPIVPQGRAGEPTGVDCPVCGSGRTLNSRSLAQDRVTVLECGACAGMWVGRRAFELIAEKARGVAASADEPLAATAAGGGASPAAQHGSLYRRCPECNQMMNRRNFGRRSGIVIDSCKDHGIWFDAEELDRILRWIRQGGEARSRKRADEERGRGVSAADRFLNQRLDRMAGQGSTSIRVERTGFDRDDLVGGMIRLLFDL